MSFTQRFAAFGLMSMLALGSAAVTVVAPTPVLAGTGASSRVLRSGSFQVGAKSKSIQGRAKLVRKKSGKYVIKFDENFKTSNGPNLLVVLHKEQTPQNYNKNTYVSLGDLKKVQGKQEYELPATLTDVSDYKSVVVWCKEFNVTFGHANLEG